MKIATLALAALGTLSVSSARSQDAPMPDGFSVASLHGSYAGIFSGKIKIGNKLRPIVGTEVFFADGQGNLTGHETFTVGTTPCEATLSGTYAVERDGTGSLDVAFTTSTEGCISGTFTESFAIAQRGALVLLANTNGDQITAEWHRQ